MKTLKQEFLYTLLIIAIILLWNSETLYISVTFLAFLFLNTCYYILKSKSKENLLIENKKLGRIDYFRLIIGLAIFVLGFIKNESSASLFGIDGKVYIGFFFVMNGILNTQTYILLITKKSVFFNDNIFFASWKLKEIDNVIVYKDKIEFINEPQIKSYEFNPDSVELTMIYDYLRDILKQNITIK